MRTKLTALTSVWAAYILVCIGLHHYLDLAWQMPLYSAFVFALGLMNGNAEPLASAMGFFILLTCDP